MPIRRVAVVAFPGVHALDVFGPIEVFDAATGLLAAAGRPGYEVGVTTCGGTPVRTSSRIDIAATWPLESFAGTDTRALDARALDARALDTRALDTLLVAGGNGSRIASQDAELVGHVRAAADNARRVGSVCTGAFVLAAAGLLDGRPATTHWAWADGLADTFPSVDVRADSIYTRSDEVWTSAGVTAGMDLALAMVAADHDDEVARQVAQWLVIYLRRSGGQSQFSASTGAATARRDEIRRTQDAIAADPSIDHSVDRLAAAASMSPRHFARVFRDQLGTTPARYVESCRIDLARSLLETTDLTVSEVARRCGIGNASTLHRLFERRLATTPALYRTHFRSTAQTPTKGQP